MTVPTSAPEPPRPKFRTNTYGVTITHRPISSWPWPVTKFPDRAAFKSVWGKTLTLLSRELAQQNVYKAIIEMDVADHFVRKDGMLRADARPRSARVVVTFEHRKHGWIRYHCDRYTKWQDNVRSIALAMDALRAVDRWGVSAGEQYSGFSTARALSGEVMTTAQAFEYVWDVADGSFDVKQMEEVSVEDVRSVVRAALMNAHPDRGGDSVRLQAIQQCRSILTQHFGQEV